MKNIKKFLLIVLIIILNSCDINILTKYEKYVNYKSYNILPNSGMMFNPINTLDINWLNGNIEITKSTEYDKVTIFEKTADEYKKDDFLCHYYRKDDTLFVKYAKSNISMPKKINKSLSVYIPSDMKLDCINIDAVSSNISLSNIAINSLDVETVSGKIEISDTNIKEMNFETVSGNIMAFVDNNTTKVNVDSVSGSIILSVCEDIKGFEVDFDTKTGTFTKDFDVVRNSKNNYAYMDSSLLSLTIKTVSGNLSIAKNIIDKINNSRKK
ncbi:MAG: DUF4097 family beta strand repeat-containing protein [Candidatus Caccosoma sp.]|nr:DUF4097 family beta strand repeat-containing protein [Candidatus Caccosoma sp.]